MEMSAEHLEKNDRIYARCNTQLKQQIQYAASLKGLDLTTYVLSTLAADADKTVQEHDIMRLGKRDREAFANALINPPAPNKNLIAAAKRYKERMKR